MRYETAFSAADALTQFRLPHWREEVYKIEPLPDSPSVPDERAEAQRQGDEQVRRLNELAAERGRRQAAEAECDRIRAELRIVTEQRDGAREALGASDRELREDRAELKRLREERDYAHRMLAEARGHREALISAIYGPDGEPKRIASPDDAVDAAASIARERREERDALQKQLDALVKWVQAEFIKTSEQARQLVRVLEGIDQ